jgi:hypothetical protein
MDAHENDISTVAMQDQGVQNELPRYSTGQVSMPGSSLDRLKSSDYNFSSVLVRTNGGSVHDNTTDSDDQKPAAKSRHNTRARNGILKQRIEVSSDCLRNLCPFARGRMKAPSSLLLTLPPLFECHSELCSPKRRRGYL